MSDNEDTKALDDFIDIDNLVFTTRPETNEEPLEVIMEGENPKAPSRKFNPQTARFEYTDPALQEKAKKREDQIWVPDKLQNRLDGLRKHLSRKNLEKSIGKTGNSTTGEISETDKEVADTQTEHSKIYILRSRSPRD